MNSLVKKAVVLITVLFWIGTSFGASLPQEQGSTATKDAAEIYSKECAKCHGKDGRGKSLRGKMTGARDFTDAKWQEGITDNDIVKGITGGKGKMPAFAKKLSEDQIKSLVPVVRSFKGASDKH
jgi:cytochrome c6